MAHDHSRRCLRANPPRRRLGTVPLPIDDTQATYSGELPSPTMLLSFFGGSPLGHYFLFSGDRFGSHISLSRLIRSLRGRCRDKESDLLLNQQLRQIQILEACVRTHSYVTNVSKAIGLSNR
ncbi:hypothetical protein M6B38_139355 [Iris pallida]|uniref:Uncharacterized protein n=1 Tax=Iris pallida TaxID=29817 RepID=A0AAX6FC64_IRIPA|nr:hypothetical protein M6B38_139355 [Iris pallida]